jgi:hypothetical protein
VAAVTATVAADGTLTFTGLEEPSVAAGPYVPYLAYAVVGGQHRKLQFSARRGSGPPSEFYPY